MSACGKISLCGDEIFTFLDMVLQWDVGVLGFGVYQKKNQCLNYLNAGSFHTIAIFRAIPHGVSLRLNLLI